MYASILDAVAHDRQNDRLARAGAARRAAGTNAGATSDAGPSRSAGRRRAHPVRGFYRWLAAGQL